MGGAGRSGDGCEWLAGLVWEGLRGHGMGFERLVGLVWEGLDCAGFVYKILKTTVASSDMQRWWPSAGILCMD